MEKKTDKLHIPIEPKYKKLIEKIAFLENQDHVPFCRKIILDYLRDNYHNEFLAAQKFIMGDKHPEDDDVQPY